MAAMHSQRFQKDTLPRRPRGPAGVVGCMLLLTLSACERPEPAPVPLPTLADAAPSRAEPAPAAPETAAPLEVHLAVRKPPHLTGSRLTGALVLTVRNPGAAPVDVIHPDVHGLRFVDTTTGAEHTVLHPCDCAFVLGLDPYPEARHLRLAPGASTEVVLDAWDCGGGPFHLPPPGRYRVTWRLAAPAVPDGQRMERLEQRCQAVLHRDDVWRGAPESNAVELELSKETQRSRR